MKLKDLLLEAEVEASVEDALDQVTSDLAKADIDENNTNDVTNEEDQIVSDNITNKENNDQSLSMDQDSKDQISKTDNLNENKDK